MVKKILFCGVDNAGKTSIIYSLKNQYSFLNELKPTMGIHRSTHKILNIELILWDLGGQKKFIDDYFQRADFIFTDIGLLIYVIDIQNQERFEDSLNYYSRILNTIRTYEGKPTIIILFHKLDPNIEFEKKYLMFVDDLTKQILSISGDFNITFFKTTIFKKWSLINAFSFGLKQLSGEPAQNILTYLKKWASSLSANALLLINEDEVIIGEFFKNKESADEIQAIMDKITPLISESIKSNNSVTLKIGKSTISMDPLSIGKYNLVLVKYTSELENVEKMISYSIDFSKYQGLEGLLNSYF